MKINHLGYGAAMIALGSLMLAGCKGGDASQQQQQAPSLAVMTVTEEDASMNTVYPATLHGVNDVEIRPQISGFLTQVHVQEGQRVAAGQVLFTIDQVQLQAAVDAARAAIEVAQANVNTAQTSANNNKILLDKNIISASAYQTSVDALNAAKAQLHQAQANLITAQKNLSYSVVKAPTAGIVGTIDNKAGSLVSPSTLLTVLSDNGGMEAYFSMTEKEVLDLTDGGRRTVKEAIATMPEVQLQLATGTLYPYKGKIVSISGVLDTQTGSATVKASFPNPDGMLRSGNTGQVLVPTTTSGALKIPQKATFEIQDMKFCYVVGDSSKIHTTPITVSELSDGQTYIVTSGLKPGDVIVTEGVGISLQDGMVINPKTGAAPQQQPAK
ncbi:MAG: efflux RND transporter periplasmic adaptor subunit [Muribaculaceae bacterium]|nr:efflux RND transporter periplasmic adaptor subunit [Muribaculaceae bacterium]